jgi:precorrin-2/cobalt-factor-2 C20-methyltransferase
MGPGSPDLVTIGALRLLEEAGVILLPVSGAGRDSVAGTVCESLFERGQLRWERSRTREFRFPMINDASRRDDEIIGQLNDLRPVWENASIVALPVIGDSVLFATASYLYSVWRRLCPDIELKLLPGISAHSLASGIAGEFLAMGEERLAILPGSASLEKLTGSMRAADCVALYKPSALGAELTSLVESTGPWSKAVRVHRAGLNDQFVAAGREAILPTEDYLSVLLLWRNRGK